MKELAMELFNKTWSLIDQERRSPKDEEDMERAAFGSYYHWAQVGTAENLAVSEWQIAHVYVLLGLPQEANRFADRCLRTCKDNGYSDYKLAFGLAVKARALALRGDLEDAKKVRAEAESVATAMEDPEDREVFFKQFADGPWFGANKD